MTIKNGERKIVVDDENSTVKIELPGAVPDITIISSEEFQQYLDKLPLDKKRKEEILRVFQEEKRKIKP